MKRCLCLLMALLFAFTVFSSSVSAASSDTGSLATDLTPAEVKSLINNAFPEYINQNTSAQFSDYSVQTRSSEQAHLVYEETRSVSDDISVTYVEYSNGRALAYLRYNVSSVSSSSNSYASSHTVDIYITCYGSSGQVKIDNFQYVLVNNGYDSISSRGSIENKLADSPALPGAYQMSETASGNAYAQYSCYFVSYLEGGYEGGLYRTVTGTITVSVGDDLLQVSMNEIVG